MRPSCSCGQFVAAALPVVGFFSRDSFGVVVCCTTMSVQGLCPNCGRQVRGSDKLAGHERKCPNCGSAIQFASAHLGAPPALIPPPSHSPRGIAAASTGQSKLRRWTGLVVAFVCGAAAVAIPARIWQVEAQEKMRSLRALDQGAIDDLTKSVEIYERDQMHREATQRDRGEYFPCSPDQLMNALKEVYAVRKTNKIGVPDSTHFVVGDDVDLWVAGDENHISRVELEFPEPQLGAAVIKCIADPLDLPESAYRIVNLGYQSDIDSTITEQFDRAEAIVSKVGYPTSYTHVVIRRLAIRPAKS